MTTEDWRYRKAVKRVKKVKGFYSHFATWLVFSAFFFILNITTSRGDIWFIYPSLGWGIGVIMHALAVFGLPMLGKDWEERLMEREMDRINREEEIREWGRQQRTPHIPSRTGSEDEDLELRELRKEKEWRDSDLV